jgi:pyruvate,water dikinase
LVAKNVGPRWSPLLPLIGALVLDEGSMGQHAAAIAREYGVPAVVATQHATSRIQTGQQVLVNGTEGVIQFE